MKSVGIERGDHSSAVVPSDTEEADNIPRAHIQGRTVAKAFMGIGFVAGISVMAHGVLALPNNSHGQRGWSSRNTVEVLTGVFAASPALLYGASKFVLFCVGVVKGTHRDEPYDRATRLLAIREQGA